MERRIISVELREFLKELLNLTTMTVATADIGGEPHAAAVYFVCDEDLRLYFFSDSNSQHALDAAHNSRAAVTVHPDLTNWQDIHGLQMRGIIQIVQSQSKWQKAWQQYLAKFPFVADLEQLVAINQLHVFNPYWIRLVDNRRGFGYKLEWAREDATNGDGTWHLQANDHRTSDGTDG